MRPSRVAVFRILASEALVDATRRRLVPVIAAAALLSLLAVDSCTACSSGQITQNGQLMDVTSVAGWTGMVIFSVLSLWIMVLAGALASDHLAEPLSDGSASLVLARPVARSEFVLARLTGSLTIAWATGLVLLSGTGYLLHARHDVSLGAAAWGALACATGSLVVATLAMALSLYLNRVATLLCVFVFVGAVTFVNSFSLFGAKLGSLGVIVQNFAPPLLTAVVVALRPWIAPVVPDVDPVIMVLKLAFWAVVSGLLLLAAFRREELQ